MSLLLVLFPDRATTEGMCRTGETVAHYRANLGLLLVNMRSQSVLRPKPIIYKPLNRGSQRHRPGKNCSSDLLPSSTRLAPNGTRSLVNVLAMRVHRQGVCRTESPEGGRLRTFRAAVLRFTWTVSAASWDRPSVSECHDMWPRGPGWQFAKPVASFMVEWCGQVASSGDATPASLPVLPR